MNRVTPPLRRFRWTEHESGAAVLSFDVATAAEGPCEVAPGPRTEATLSPAQRAVALLAVHGHSNAEIALELGISRRTVANHMASILAKTTATSRCHLARFIIG